MNYTKHYNRLIERATTRKLDTYTEKHHIVPKCMGGTNKKSNLVRLTPEEHYVAHQLLVKIHPENIKLVHAALMMCIKSKIHCRNNKRYGWLKRKYSKVCKKRVGSKNPSYGRSWYHDPDTLQSGKFLVEDIPTGWILGKVPKPKCFACSKATSHRYRKYCDEHQEILKIKAKRDSKEKYQRLWELYQMSEYTSASKFAKSDLCDVSVQTLSYHWRMHIEGYELAPVRGKKFSLQKQSN